MMMANTIDPALADRLRDASEQTKNDTYPAGTAGRRPNRRKVYSVRLTAEEEAEVPKVAAAKHLPASTLVRSWILERLNASNSHLNMLPCRHPSECRLGPTTSTAGQSSRATVARPTSSRVSTVGKSAASPASRWFIST